MRRLITSDVSTPVRIVPVAILMVLALWAVVEAASGSWTQSTAARGDSKTPFDWTGIYTTGGSSNADVPQGFETINPYRMLDEVVTSRLQPWALAKQQATDFDTDDTGALCQPDGFFRHFPNAEFELLPSAGKMTLVCTGVGLSTSGVRRIYLNRPHPKELHPGWNGDSIGHWEGDTLVVDSIGFNDKSWLMSDREPHTEALHLVERMRLVADRTYLEIQTTVEDPGALTTPYTFTRYYRKLGANAEPDMNICNENLRQWRRMLDNINAKKRTSRPASNK
jgi:hypothetical protein